MSQEPTLTIEYEQPRASVCPPGCDTDNAVSVQLGVRMAGSGILPGQASGFPQQPPAGSKAIPHGGLLESPAWPLDASGPGREPR